MHILGEISKHFEPKPAPAPKAPVVHADIVQALIDCEEYLDNRADVRDGDYGIPEPNKEMQLLCAVRDALKLAGV